jgi:hypothetical protein
MNNDPQKGHDGMGFIFPYQSNVALNFLAWTSNCKTINFWQSQNLCGNDWGAMPCVYYNFSNASIAFSITNK